MLARRGPVWRTGMRAVMMTVATTFALNGAAMAKPALNEVEKIDEGLFAVGLAHEIRKNCPDISPRYFRALGFLRYLEATAREMGYTKAEVEAHLDSDVEKDRLRARASRLMNARGLKQDEQGYCDLGRQEISAGSATGRLLREAR